MTAKIILSAALLLALPLSSSAFNPPSDCAEVKRIWEESKSIPHCQTCAPKHQAKLNEIKLAHERCMAGLSGMAETHQVNNSRFPGSGFDGEYSLMPSWNN